MINAPSCCEQPGVILRSKCERSAWVRDFPDVSRSCLDASGITNCWEAGNSCSAVHLLQDRSPVRGIPAPQPRSRSLIDTSAASAVSGHGEAGADAPLRRVAERIRRRGSKRRARQRPRGSDEIRRRAASRSRRRSRRSAQARAVADTVQRLFELRRRQSITSTRPAIRFRAFGGYFMVIRRG
jgi:hypothetical protein